MAEDSSPAKSKDRTLPQTPGYSYIYVDMRENYDEKLLTRFYNDLMIPNFPIADGTRARFSLKRIVIFHPIFSYFFS